jgi:uncharacterized protein (TIGR03067 family)
MKWITLCAVALACAAVSLAGAKAKDAPSDRDALQGSWKLVGRVMRGEPQPVDGDAARRLVFEGDRFRMYRGDELLFDGTFKVNAGATPRTIDATIDKSNEEAELAGKTSLGIYELKGDELKWCAAQPGSSNRPTDFSGKEDEQLLVTFKREAK